MYKLVRDDSGTPIKPGMQVTDYMGHRVTLITFNPETDRVYVKREKEVVERELYAIGINGKFVEIEQKAG